MDAEGRQIGMLRDQIKYGPTEPPWEVTHAVRSLVGNSPLTHPVVTYVCAAKPHAVNESERIVATW